MSEQLLRDILDVDTMRPPVQSRGDGPINHDRQRPKTERVSASPFPSQSKRASVKRSAIVSARALERWRPWLERIAALALLGLSFLSTVAVLNGGWGPTLALHWSAGAWVGVGIQSACTVVEWSYKRDKRNVWYVIALAFDAGPTALGAYALLAPTVQRGIALLHLTGQSADVLSWIIIIFAAVLLAMAPESILIDD